MIIDRILNLRINFIQSFGILLVFLATFLEGLPIIGFVIPGALIIFFAGFFSKIGLLGFYAVLIFSILGAILGDAAGYIIGRFFEKSFLHKYGRYLLINKSQIEKTHELVHCHTGKSLIIGRLNPFTRCFAPFLAGTHKVSFGKFMLYNVIGGVLYSFLFVSLGYIFGHSYRVAEKFEKWIIIATLAIVIIFYLNYLAKFIFKKMNGGSNGSDCEEQDKGSCERSPGFRRRSRSSK